jgi:hypothetical protein
MLIKLLFKATGRNARKQNNENVGYLLKARTVKRRGMHTGYWW